MCSHTANTARGAQKASAGVCAGLVFRSLIAVEDLEDLVDIVDILLRLRLAGIGLLLRGGICADGLRGSLPLLGKAGK